MTANNITMNGGSAANATASALTFEGGDISLIAMSALLIQGGDASVGASTANVNTKGGGIITLSGSTVDLNGGTGLISDVNVIAQKNNDPTSIFIQGVNNINFIGSSSSVNIATDWIGQGGILIESVLGSLNMTDTAIVNNSSTGVNNFVEIQASNDLSSTRTFIGTAFGNMTLNGINGEVSFQESKLVANVLSAPAMTKALSVFAGTNILLDDTTSIKVTNATSDALALFVIDQGGSMTSGFTYPIGAKVTVNGGFADLGFVRIYTVTRGLNTVPTGTIINGLPFVPGPEFVDSDHEVWDTSYPTIGAGNEDGSQHFTIYYKVAVPKPAPPPAP